MVLARSTPEDKYLLVTGLRNDGSVVAVTGDGTNDAPALKRADVGFSMGITGTEVAKEASEIVLLDDNFSSMVTAVKWGRNIYNNVRKFLQFQLTVNIVAMFIVFSGGAAFGDAPLTSVQMLWVNLIMDTFAALALATEPPTDDILNRKPYSKFEDIVTQTMWRNIFGQAFFQILVLIVLLVWGQDLLAIDSINGHACDWTTEKFFIENAAGDLEATCKTVKYTMIFNTFVFMQVFNEINSRKLGEREFNVFAGFFNNWLFTLILILTIAVQVVLVQYGGFPVRCTPLTQVQHGICLGIGFASLIVGAFIKFIPSRLFKFMRISTEDPEASLKSGPVNALRKSLTLSMRKKLEKEGLQHGIN
jgi:Ca2+ transporting ATPase